MTQLIDVDDTSSLNGWRELARIKSLDSAQLDSTGFASKRGALEIYP
jgi:hypothetical protein